MNSSEVKETKKERISIDAFPPKWASEWGEDAYGLFADFRFHSHETGSQAIVQRFRWIAAGDFMMGSPNSELERFAEREYLHSVSLTQGYWLADTTVTQSLWQAVMKDNPAIFKGADNPVENISWNDTQDFLRLLNMHYKKKLFQQVLRLPTDAEWEHACRAGTTTPFSFGENISPEQVNYDGYFPYIYGEKGRNRRETVAVKSLPINPWGLYEMHGNVLEWCEDAWKASLGLDPVADPVQQSGSGWSPYNRVVRGGAWSSYGRVVRSAYRLLHSPSDRLKRLGFRLSLGHDLKSGKSVR